MGLLKHIILPLLAIVHGFQAFQIYVHGKDALPEYYGWPDTKPLSQREVHLVGIIASVSVALMINCLVGVFFENAHYRGLVTFLEVVYFSLEALDAYSSGYPLIVKLTLALVCAVGLMVHAMEPGIFTKDKSGKNKST